MSPIVSDPPVITSDDYVALSYTDTLFIGPHNLFQRNGVVLNDRSLLETYWVEEMTGFDSADLVISAQPNAQEDGELPDPGFHGGRTMTMTGWIQAGTYTQMMRMGTALLDSMLDLDELPLQIYVKDPDGGMFHQAPVIINCRPADKPQIATKIVREDLTGIFKRNFTIALRASTDPTYRAVAVKTLTIIPEVISELGRAYDRSYDLAYDQLMDESGSPAAAGNLDTAQNDGNWDATPIIRFNGPQSGTVFTNAFNGHKIILKESIQVGDYIEVDVDAGTVRDALGVDRGSAWDSRSDWMVLGGKRGSLTGANVLSLAVASFGDGASVDVTWQDTSL